MAMRKQKSRKQARAKQIKISADNVNLNKKEWAEDQEDIEARQQENNKTQEVELQSKSELVHQDLAFSEAWPKANSNENLMRSNNHKHAKQLMQRYSKEQVLDMMYFREIQQSDYPELKLLHKEWFPLNYPESFYTKTMNKHNCIKIGCFVKFNFNKDSDGSSEETKDVEQENEGKTIEFMIGSIISRIKRGKEDVVEIYQHHQSASRGQQGWIAYLLSSFTCKNLFQDTSAMMGCYIMTLGVIDECRTLGLGTLLLQELYQYLDNLYPECKMLYLHVVDYNVAAIKFYCQRNSFQLFKHMEDFYEIFGKMYDAQYLYKFIDNSRFRTIKTSS